MKGFKNDYKNMLRDLHEKLSINGKEIGDMKTMGKDKMEGLELKNTMCYIKNFVRHDWQLRGHNRRNGH